MMSRSFCGSVAYLPPEMLRRKGHDKSVDWYLLGVLSYEMLVGKPPYYSSNRERLYYNIQKARLTFPKHVSPEAQSFIRSLIDRVPKRRIGYGADDVEEVKRHEFLSDINWDMVINKQYTPHQPVIPRRQHKHIPLEEAFGELEVEIPERKIEGWSVMEV